MNKQEEWNVRTDCAIKKWKVLAWTRREAIRKVEKQTTGKVLRCWR